MTTHRHPFEQQATKSPPWTRYSTWILLMGGVAAFAVAAILIAYESAGSDGLQVSVFSASLFVVGLVAAVVGLVWDGRLNKRDALATAGHTVSERIQTVASAIREAGTLMAELDAHLAAQSAALERARGDNEDFETKATLYRKESKAVADLVTSAMESAQLTMARANRRDQWLFFTLGVLVAIPVELLISQLA